MHPAHPPLLFGGVTTGSGALDDGAGVATAVALFMSISGTSLRTSFVSGIEPLPGWTNPSFVAAIVWVVPPGGPPHTPRRGSLHAIAPVHGWRIA